MRNNSINKFHIRYIRLCLSLKDSILALLFSFIVIISFIVGFFMDKEYSLSLNNAKKIVGGGIVVLLVLFGAELYLRFRDLLINHMSKEKPEIASNDRKAYFIYLCIIMLMWLPVLFAYYPGVFAYDVDMQIPQTMGTYNMGHPLIHTLLLQFFYYIIGERLIGNYNLGMLCYVVFQMLFLAIAIAYMHLFLYRMKVGRTVRLVLLIFTGIFPVYSVLSISMTKDIIFAAFFLISFLCLCYWEMTPEFFKKKHMGALYFFSSIGMVLFRNNGIIALISIVIISLPFLRKGRKWLFIMSVMTILAAVFLQGMLKYSTHASVGSANEMLSVPYQQLSYVYNTKQDELSQDDIRTIESIIPKVQNYKLHIADAVKGSALPGTHGKELIFIYLRMFIKYPSSYISAFLYNTMGYWYLFDTSNAEIYGNRERYGYLLTDTKPDLGVEHISYFPALENLYENLFSLNKYQENPLLFILCSMALYFWLVVLCAFYALSLKRRQALVPIVFLSSYILTLYAGPCALIRYFFPIISCIPPLFVVVLKQKIENENPFD